MELSSPATASLWILFAVHLFVAAIGQFWFLYRRHRQPIVARFPVSAAVTLLVLTIHLETSILAYVSPLPCLLAYCIESTLGTIGTIGYTLRSAMFFWQCRIVRSKMSASSVTLYQNQVLRAGQGRMSQLTSKIQDAGAAAPALSKSDAWYLANQWITSNRFVVPFWIVIALLLAVYLVVSLLSTNWDGGRDNCIDMDPRFYLWRQAWFLGWIGALGYYSFRLRVCVDGLFIKRELLSSFASGIVYFVFWFAPGVTAYDATTYPILTIGYWVLIQFDYLVSVWVPIVLSYRKFDDQTADVSGIVRLDDFLKSDPVAIAAFAEFLCREFAVENLQFLLAVNAFKRRFGDKRKAHAWASTGGSVVALSMSSNDGDVEAPRSTGWSGEDAIWAHANDICHEYVHADAPSAINLSGKCRERILAAMDSSRAVPVALFDEGAAEIKRILEPSSYMRFLQSETGRQLIGAG
ncbi:RGS domain-containing protein [Plasmodiophora brassicae]